MFEKNRKTTLGADPDDLIYADTQSAEAGKRPPTGISRRLTAVLVALALVLAVVTAALTLGISLQHREDRYTAAQILLADKEYEDALTIFQSLGDHRDSRAQAAALEQNAAAYAAAEELLSQQRYEEALSAFRALGDYADSAQRAAYDVTYRKALDLLTEIDTGKTQLLTRILTDQVRLTDEKSYPTIVGYETAAALLESLGDYKSAPALRDRCYYSAGLVKLGWEDWDGALVYLEKMTEETAAEFYQEYLQHYEQKTKEGR